MENALLFFGTLLLFLGLGNLFTYVLQDYFIFRPKKLPARFKFNFNTHFEEVFLKAKGNGLIHCIWVPHTADSPSGKIVVYCHGNKDNLLRWGHYHHYYKKLGYDFFAFDYRRFGKSTGKATEKLLYHDALMIYDYVLQTYKPENVVLVGRSMGSTFALKIAACRPCDGLILETPFASMPDLFHIYYPMLPKLFIFKYHFNNLKLMHLVRCPVLLIQGTADRIVPIQSALKLKRHLKPEDHLVIIPTARHNNLHSFDAYHQAVRQFLSL